MIAQATEFILRLRAVADPLAGPGVPERDPGYRLRRALKVLLRTHGLRCVQVTDGDKARIAPRIDAEPSRN